MTDDELQNKLDEIFALFNHLPNNANRNFYYKRWLSLRIEQSKRIYGKDNNDSSTRSKTTRL